MRTRQASRPERVLVRAQREREAARLAIVQVRREEDSHCLVPVESRRLVGSHLLVDSLGLGLVGIHRLVDSLGLGCWAAAAGIHGRGQLLIARCHAAAAAAGQQQLVADRSRTRASPKSTQRFGTRLGGGSERVKTRNTKNIQFSSDRLTDRQTDRRLRTAVSSAERAESLGL